MTLSCWSVPHEQPQQPRLLQAQLAPGWLRVTPRQVSCDCGSSGAVHPEGRSRLPPQTWGSQTRGRNHSRPEGCAQDLGGNQEFGVKPEVSVVNLGVTGRSGA